MKTRRVDGYDVIAGVGLLLLCYGVYLVVPAVAWIVGGLALMAFGTVGAWSKGRP